MRAMLPFLFAASAVHDGHLITLMLFHDSVHTAVKGADAHHQRPLNVSSRWPGIAERR